MYTDVEKPSSIKKVENKNKNSNAHTIPPLPRNL